jgi:hypothetical protein
MIRDFYIYKVIHNITNEYYIGMRTKPINCKLGLDWYLYDNYWGSQIGWLELKKLNKNEKSKILKKEIISIHYNTTQKKVAIIESDIIKANIQDPLNRNYHYDFSGGFAIGHKNPAVKRKNTKYSPTSIVFYYNVPYRLNDLNLLLNIKFLDSIKLIDNGDIVPMKEYIKTNYYVHTKKLIIFNELKTVLDWKDDDRFNTNKFLKSTHLLKWYLDTEGINYRELTIEEIGSILSSHQIGIKKPKTSEYMKYNNPSKRQDVKDKISVANKKEKIKKQCPHCNKLVGNKTYHFDNCLMKIGNENINFNRGKCNKIRNAIKCPHCNMMCIGKNKWHFDNCKLAPKNK